MSMNLGRIHNEINIRVEIIPVYSYIKVFILSLFIPISSTASICNGSSKLSLIFCKISSFTISPRPGLYRSKKPFLPSPKETGRIYKDTLYKDKLFAGENVFFSIYFTSFAYHSLQTFKHCCTFALFWLELLLS